MVSEENNLVFLNKDDPKIEYVEEASYLGQILDIPEVEIIDDDESNCNREQIIDSKVNKAAAEVESRLDEFNGSEEGWEEEKVKVLLNMYLENIDKFRNPKVKKKLLWNKIAAVVGKDSDTCHKKYRNMKQHYVNVLKKKKQFGRNPIRWPFFTLFEQIESKGGFDLRRYESNDMFKYRPIAKKPEWGGTPQFLVVSNGPMVKNPIVLNTASPLNSGLGGISVGDLPETGPQKKRKLEEFQSISEELRKRQLNIEQKLDRLVAAVEESNIIQRERNKLFQEYLKKINK